MLHEDEELVQVDFFDLCEAPLTTVSTRLGSQTTKEEKSGEKKQHADDEVAEGTFPVRLG
jgi:hypothetical protein